MVMDSSDDDIFYSSELHGFTLKILFVGDGLLDTDNYPTSNKGASVQTWGNSRELAKRGHEVFIVRRSDTKGEEIVENVNLVGIEFKGQVTDMIPFLSHLTRMSSSLYFSMRSLELIERIRPNIMCLINRVSGIFPSELKIPKVYIMHSPEALDFFKAYSISANRLNSVLFYVKKAIEKRVMQKSDRVVVLNRYIERYLRMKGLRNVVRIPNGINAEEFSNKGEEDFILYAGRFDWNKNVVSLINAFAKIRTYYNLCLVGSGPEEEKIRSMMQQKKLRDRVIMVPAVPRRKLLEIMSRCSVFVLPSLFEVYPNVVLEAMASAKPVIARANMGTVDIILHGKSGYLYNNEEELRKYLELLLSDNSLRKKIGHSARKIVEKKYSFVRVADRYEELFRRMYAR